MKSSSDRLYSSPLRKDQAAQTQLRIIEAAAQLITGGVEAVTMPMVAKEAGVALRTVFRYFPTREELLDATWNALNAQLGDFPDMNSLDELTDFIPQLYSRYGSIEDQIRAVMLSSVLQASRKRQGSLRRRQLRTSMEALIQISDDRQERMARSAAYLMTIPTAMLFLKDNYELTTEEAAASAAWALRVLIEAAKTNPPKAPQP